MISFKANINVLFLFAAHHVENIGYKGLKKKNHVFG